MAPRDQSDCRGKHSQKVPTAGVPVAATIFALVHDPEVFQLEDAPSFCREEQAEQ
jgi:hypothetical protein